MPQEPTNLSHTSLAILESTADWAQLTAQHPKAVPSAAWVTSGGAAALLGTTRSPALHQADSRFRLRPTQPTSVGNHYLRAPPPHPDTNLTSSWGCADTPHPAHDRLKAAVQPRHGHAADRARSSAPWHSGWCGAINPITRQGLVPSSLHFLL